MYNGNMNIIHPRGNRHSLGTSDTDEGYKLMTNGFEQITFSSNDYLVREGATDEAAFLITSGKVEIRKGELSNSPLTLAVLGKGEVIGEMALFDDHPHMASAIALEETKVSAISRDEFQRRAAYMDPVMRGIVTILIKRIRNLSDMVSAQTTDVNWSNWKN